MFENTLGVLDRRARGALSRVAILFVAGLAACHSSGVETAPGIDQRRIGVYQFSERITANGRAATSVDLDGQFVVLGDTVTVDARPGPCKYETTSTAGTPIIYTCGSDITLTFDRQDPVGKAAYSVMLSVQQTTSVCIRYTTDASGRRICAETQQQTSDRKVRQSGRLHAIRVASSGDPPDE